MDQRGWIEQDWQPKYEKENFKSQCFEFLYTTKSRDAFRMPLAPWQYVNHILGAKALTTKVGLTHMMKNLVWQHELDISNTFPQSFDLSDLESEETKNFREDCKFSQVLAVLKQALGDKDKALLGKKEKVMVCLAIAERRAYVLSGQLFEDLRGDCNFKVSELDTVSDSIYDWLKEGAAVDFSRTAWYRPLAK